METTLKKDSRFRLSDKTRKLIVDVICYLFVLLFMYAATSKLLDYDKFKIQIGKSPIITNYAFILAWLVPLSEIIISVMVIISRTVMLGLYLALSLMSLFTVYIIAILNFSDSIPCSCGGVLEKMTWTEHLIFNFVFILLAITGVLLQSKILEIQAIEKPY